MYPSKLDFNTLAKFLMFISIKCLNEMYSAFLDSSSVKYFRADFMYSGAEFLEISEDPLLLTY